MPLPTMTYRSTKRVDRAITGLGAIEMVEGPLLIAGLTKLLEENIGKELASHRRTGGTEKSLTSHAEGLSGVVEVAGGAPYIEFGTQAHGPKDAKVMHWVATEGPYPGEFWRTKVAGVTADDFVGRAIEKTDAEAVLTAAFGKSFLSAFEGDI